MALAIQVTYIYLHLFVDFYGVFHVGKYAMTTEITCVFFQFSRYLGYYISLQVSKISRSKGTRS